MKKLIATTFLLYMITITATAQLNPIPSLYFSNRYQANPAYAGTDHAVELQSAMKVQWSGYPGAPMMEQFTASFRTGPQMGGGMLVYHETAGLHQRTELKGSYAYHIPLDWEEGNSLDLGLNANIQWQQVDLNKARGDLADEILNAYNQRGASFDGDFGVAWRYRGWTAQAVLPNIRALLQNQNSRTIASRYCGLAALSYRWTLGQDESTTMEPMAMLRYLQGSAWLWDAGCQMTFEEGKLHGAAIYHGTGSLTVQIGMLYDQSFGFAAAYSSSSRQMGELSRGEFSISLKYIPTKRKPTRINP